MPVQRKQWLMNSVGVGHSGRPETQRDVARNFQCHGKFSDEDPHLDQTHTQYSQNVVRRDQIAGVVLGTVTGRGRALLRSSGYNTKCLYEAL